MPPQLIINADDFGLTPGVNRAIAELHQAGALTSATLMANGPAFDHAVDLARQNPGLAIGCHVVFTDGVPVSHPYDIPTLLGADGKTFRSSPVDFLQALLRGTIRPDEIMREAFAQIQKLQRAGIDVTHLDTHKHTHCLPPVARSLVHVAERCGIGAIRNPFEPSWGSALRQGSGFRRFQLNLLNRLFRQPFLDLLRRSQVATTDGTLAMSGTGELDSSALAATVAAFPQDGIFELMVHPGYNDADLDRVVTRLRGSREVERAALLQHIPGPGVPTLTDYGHLGPFAVVRDLGQFRPHTGFENVT